MCARNSIDLSFAVSGGDNILSEFGQSNTGRGPQKLSAGGQHHYHCPRSSAISSPYRFILRSSDCRVTFKSRAAAERL